MTDAELLRRWKRHSDAEAFQELVRRYAGLVHASATRILRDPNLAEEVAQECFEKLATRQAMPRRSLPAWLHRVAVNRALDIRKSELRRARRNEAYARQQREMIELRRHDLADVIDEAVDSLPRVDREVVLAYFYRQQTHAEIAESIGISRRTVSHRIQKSVQRLRRQLAEHGIRTSATALGALLGGNLMAPPPPALAESLGRLAIAGSRQTKWRVLGSRLLSPGRIPAVVGSLVAVVVVVSSVPVVVGGGDSPLMPDAGSPDAFPESYSDEETARVATASETSSEDAPASPVAQPPAELAPIATIISGSIIEVEVGGIPEFEVYARHAGSGSQIVRTVTDASGRYTFEDLDPGSYTIYPGHTELRLVEPESEIRTTVSDGEQRILSPLKFTRGVVISGVVVDERGHPVPDSRVHGFIDGHTGSKRTKTNVDGTFELMGLHRGEQYFIFANHDRLAMETVGPISYTEATNQPVRLVLLDPASISGTLTDPHGRPLEGITVDASLRERRYPYGPGIDATPADSDGRFHIGRLHAGKYRLAIRIPIANGGGFRRDPLNPDRVIEISAGERIENIRLVYTPKPEGGSISGRVVNRKGKPLRYAELMVFGRAMAGIQTLKTDRDGSFQVARLPAGNVNIRASHPYYAEVRLTDVPTDTEDLVIEMEPRGRASGAVVDDSTDAPIAEFSLAESSRGQWLRGPLRWVEFVDPDGSFTLNRLQPGEREIVARAPGYVAASTPARVRSGGETSDIEIRLTPARTVGGTVSDESGAPVEGAEVVFTSGDVFRPYDRANLFATTDSDGQFQFDVEPEQRGIVHVEHRLYASAETKVDPRSQGPLNLVLPKAAEIRGRLIWAGSPVSGLDARLSHENRTKGQHHLSTDAQGNFRFSGLDSGEHLVLLGGEIRADTPQLLANIFEPVNVRPREINELEIEFPAVDTRVYGRISLVGPVSEVDYGRVYLVYRDDHPRLWEFYVPWGPDGTYDLQGVPTGSAKVMARARRTTVEKGQSASLEKLHLADVYIEDGVPIELDLDVSWE